MPAEQVQGQEKQAQKQDAGLQGGQQQQDQKAAGKSDPSAKNEQMTQGQSNLVPMEKGCKDKSRVLDMQRRLVDLGFSTNGIDGDYGNGTVKAVESFQKKNGLGVTGKADVATLEKLYALCPNPSIGALSAKYESRGGDNGAVGYDSNGGTSYGKYQLAAKVGVMGDFVKWMKSNGYASLASKLEAAAPYDTGSTSGTCPTVWKANATELEKPVEEFVLSTYYTNAIKGKTYKDFIDGSPTLRDAFYSASINHGAGGADTIVKRSYTPGMSKADFITTFYQKRKEYVRGNKYEDALVARYTNECSMALGLLALEEQGLISDSNKLSAESAKAAEEEKSNEEAPKVAEAVEAAKDNKNIEDAAHEETKEADVPEPEQTVKAEDGAKESGGEAVEAAGAEPEAATDGGFIPTGDSTVDAIQKTHPDGISVSLYGAVVKDEFGIAGYTNNSNNQEFTAQAKGGASAYKSVDYNLNMGVPMIANNVNSVKTLIKRTYDNLHSRYTSVKPESAPADPASLKIRNLSLYYHGLKDKLSMPGTNLGNDNVKDFVSEVKYALRGDVGVQLYACNTANDEKGTSFAKNMAKNLGGEALVYGHTTAAHATENSDAKVYNADGQGVWMFDVLMPESWLQKEASRIWGANYSSEAYNTLRTRARRYYNTICGLTNGWKGAERVDFEQCVKDHPVGVGFYANYSLMGRDMFANPEQAAQMLQTGWKHWAQGHERGTLSAKGALAASFEDIMATEGGSASAISDIKSTGNNAGVEAKEQSAAETTAPAAEPAAAANINVTYAVTRNKAMGYNREVWKEIQNAVGLTGADVDGYVGPVTTKKVAEYQAANGLEVDGICGPKTLAFIRSHAAPAIPETAVQEEPAKQEEEVVTAPDAPAVEPVDPAVKEEAEKEVAEEEPVQEEEPEVIPDGDWRSDVIKAGLPAEEVYEGSESLSYGHQKISGSWTGSYTKVVGGVVKTGVASRGNAVKTLQALLNRSLKDTGLGQAQADFTNVQAAGTLSIDGSWGLNSATHLMYFIQMAGHTLKDNYISKFTVKCDGTIWQELRDKKALDVNLIKQSIGAPLVDIPGSGGHKIVEGGDKAYLKMKADSGLGLDISSSFRAFSSQGMAAAGIPNKSGQLELFALRVAGMAGSDAAQPSLDASGGSHMTGKALDISSGTDWVKRNGPSYGFTNYPAENWHFNFDPNTWANSSKNR